MSKSRNYFRTAEGNRVKLTNSTKIKIKKMYKELAKDIDKRASQLNRITISDQMKSAYLKELKTEITERLEDVDRSTERLIQRSMISASRSVIKDNDKLLMKMGFAKINIANVNISNDIVAQVVSGDLYKGKWTLSKAIWSDNKKKINDINVIVAKGIASQKSTYEIAKDLERYVNPSVRKDWNWSKVYPGTNKVVDYNAQRLARTMISHAYQESFVRSTKDNPFIDAYRWVASGSDRMCPICEDRDGNIYPKDDLPLDHPNGMCTFEVVMSKDFDEIGSALADWVNGEGDTNLNDQLDDFAESLYEQGKTDINIRIFDKSYLVK